MANQTITVDDVVQMIVRMDRALRNLTQKVDHLVSCEQRRIDWGEVVPINRGTASPKQPKGQA